MFFQERPQSSGSRPQLNCIHVKSRAMNCLPKSADVSCMKLPKLYDLLLFETKKL
jgi:hypothetical protein